MKKILFVFVALSTILVACKNGNSDKEELLKAQYQHQLDSIQLANAQSKLDEAKQQKAEAPKTETKTTTPTTTVASPSVNCEYSWLSSQYVTENDLVGMTSWDLCVLRNSIYAMHGRKFKRADLRAYFSQFSWYKPLYDEVKLSQIEARNVNFIKKYE